jgi:hypothetical protein
LSSHKSQTRLAFAGAFGYSPRPAEGILHAIVETPRHHWILGQATPKSRTVEANDFVLTDEKGNMRADLSMMGGGPSLTFYITPKGKSWSKYPEEIDVESP